MTHLKRCTLSLLLALALALTTAVPAFAATPIEEGVTTVASPSYAYKSGFSSTSWTKLDGRIGLLLGTGTARATINVSSACVAYVKLVRVDTGKTVGVSTMNVTADYVGKDITFTLSPNPLLGTEYNVYVMFDKSGIHYSLMVNFTSN